MFEDVTVTLSGGEEVDTIPRPSKSNFTMPYEFWRTVQCPLSQRCRVCYSFVDSTVIKIAKFSNFF